MSQQTLYKECSRCKKLLAATTKNFSKGNAKYGLKSRCKECQKEDNKSYYNKHKDYYKTYEKKWREEHNDYYKQYVEEHKEELKEYSSNYYKVNKYKIKKRAMKRSLVSK